MKSLVAYFSASGVTANVASQLANGLGATLYEIEPGEKYSDADLDWMNKKSRSTLEMNDTNSRPAIATSVENMSQYDTVYVGFPIWWYVEPRIIDTFLDAYDFSGKTIVPFATSGGSTMSNVVKHLREVYPQYTFTEGKLLNGGVSSWIEELKK